VIMRVAYPKRIDALDKSDGNLFHVLQYVERGKKPREDARPRFEGTVIPDLSAGLSSIDLVHLTNINRPVDTHSAFLSARAAQNTIIFSFIHHSYREVERYERAGGDGVVGQISDLLGFTALEYLRCSVRGRSNSGLLTPMLKSMSVDMKTSQHTIVKGANRILVLSEDKIGILYGFGEVPDNKCICLRNGPEDRSGTYIDRKIDVCVVGLIEARKYQIAVLDALNRRGISGVFVGAEDPNQKAYCHCFKKMIADSPSTYLGGISREEALQIIRRFIVHVSNSWFEALLPADLEAYCVGCGVVASNCGGTREVLGERAVYVNPESGESIVDGITRMLEKMSGDISDRAEERAGKPISETWKLVGGRLYEIYRQTVGQSGFNG